MSAWALNVPQPQKSRYLGTCVLQRCAKNFHNALTRRYSICIHPASQLLDYNNPLFNYLMFREIYVKHKYSYRLPNANLFFFWLSRHINFIFLNILRAPKQYKWHTIQRHTVQSTWCLKVTGFKSKERSRLCYEIRNDI